MLTDLFSANKASWCSERTVDRSYTIYGSQGGSRVFRAVKERTSGLSPGPEIVLAFNTD